MPFRVVTLFLCEISKRKHPMDAIPHSVAWNVAPKKEIKLFNPKVPILSSGESSNLDQISKNDRNHVFDNAQYRDTFICRDLCNKRE